VAERPSDAQAHNVLGTVLVKLDDVDGATEQFRLAIQLEPRLTEAHVNLAQALVKAGHAAEGRVVLAEVQRRKEEEAARSRAMLLVEMASKQLDKGEVGPAVASLREAVAASPDFAEAQYQLGRALRRGPSAAAQTSAAEDALLAAVKLDPRHAAARYEWARLLADRGDLVGAEDQIRRAVELQPSLLAARRERARIALAAHDPTTAVAELQAAVAWEPGDARTRYDLAVALKASGDRREAARELGNARRLDPRLPALLP
jgi:Flp pilus assembly protein TadD